MAYNVIEVRGVIKDFGDTRAVDEVDLTVRAGELFGLIGHNLSLIHISEPTRPY